MRAEVRNWWEQSQADLKVARNNFENRDYYVCAFFCHQAVEKGLKALHLKKYSRFPKVHDLVFLSKKLRLPEKIIEKCDKLTWTYIDTRYPDMAGPLPFKKFKKSNTLRFLKLAEEILVWMKDLI